MDWKQIEQIRIHLHRHPERSFEEFETTDFIETILKEWGINFQRFENLQTGGYADAGNGKPIFAFRSDIDALPIHENDHHQIKSLNDGVMHACGHDFHTAIGLGLLKYFHEYPERLNGKLRVIFQPGEEAAPGGAEKVLKENIWNDVQSILTVHVQPQVPVGTFILFNGPVQASSTSLHIVLRSEGGHTSKPHETVDLINISGQYVVQLQAHLRQKTDSRDPIVLAFGSIHGGSTHNIIPSMVELRGTLRTLDNGVLKKSLNLIRTFSENFGKLYGVQVEVRFPTNCPATVNDPFLSRMFVEFMKSQAKEASLVQPSKPSMGSDDFSFYLQKVPGLYLLIGAGGKGNLHSENLELDGHLLKPAIKVLTDFFTFLAGEMNRQET